MKTKTWLLIAITTLFLNLTGCSIPTKQIADQPEPSTKPITDNTKGWHQVRFRIKFPEDKKAKHPHWYMGGLLANEVIKPELDKNRAQIDLWRFHRRSGPKFGHVFSFYFYSPASTATQIHQDVKANKLLQRLQAEKQITWLGLDDLTKNKKPNIDDTSDKSWSEVIQKTWPSYIMGVSQMWLDLIHEINADQQHIKDPQKRYQKVHNTITDIWKREGKHAMLHHLNAIYAYQPILMRY